MYEADCSTGIEPVFIWLSISSTIELTPILSLSAFVTSGGNSVGLTMGFEPTVFVLLSLPIGLHQHVAKRLGLEPRLTVLETVVLPLHYINI